MIRWLERLALPSISLVAIGLVTAALVKVPVRVALDSADFEHRGGFIYRTPLRLSWPWTGTSESSESRRVTGTRLRENGEALGPGRIAPIKISSIGSGRFSHWGTTLYFSTSDNTDPRENGRRYTAVLEGRLAPDALRKGLLSLAAVAAFCGLLWLRAGRISGSDLATPAAIWIGSWLAFLLVIRTDGVVLWLSLGLISILALWAVATTCRVHAKGCGRTFAGFRLAIQWTLAVGTLFLTLAAVEAYLLILERRTVDLSLAPALPRLLAAGLPTDRAPLAATNTSEESEKPLKRALREFGVEVPRRLIHEAARRNAWVTLPPELERRQVAVKGAARAFLWHGVLHVADQNGFRRNTPIPENRGDTFRVMVVGDSLTYGTGIEEEATYSRRIEALIRPDYRIEVLNLGAPGAQSEGIMTRARVFLPLLNPDLVIYGVCLNDFLPSGVGQYDNNRAYPFPLPETVKDFLLERSRLARLTEQGYDRALLAAGFRLDFYGDILKRFSDYQDRFSRDVARLNAMVKAHGLPPVVALILTQKPEVGSRGHRIAQAAERHLHAAGMDVIAIEPYLRQFDGMNFHVSRWEGHPNEVANAIWAEMLRRHIETLPALIDYRREPAASSTLPAKRIGP